MAPLFTIESEMPNHIQATLAKSWAPYFYKNITLAIDESRFKSLYAENNGRPNAPICQLVAMEILKEMKNVSDEDLFEAVETDLRMMRALGINSLEEKAPAPRTLYYFRKAVQDYEERTGRSLLREEFEHITAALIALGEVNTTSQRMDSFHIDSNIKCLSRAKIFHKVIQNMVNILPDEERAKISETMGLVKDDEDKAMFKLKPSEYKSRLQTYAENAYALVERYKNNETFNGRKEYALIKRVVDEQVKIEDAKPIVIEAKEVSAASLQNPADPEAIYNKKNTSISRGYKANVSETCAKENKTQLITNVALYDNNVSDDKILKEEIAETKERTNVEEVITDGGYPSAHSEEACEDAEVQFIATEVKGRKSSKSISTADFKIAEDGRIPECPAGHSPKNVKVNEKRVIAHFRKRHCASCPKNVNCIAVRQKKSYVVYVSKRKIAVDKRRATLADDDYKRTLDLRPPVEGAVSRLKPKYLRGRSLFRGKRQIANRLFYAAIGVNFRRMWLRIGCFFKYLRAVSLSPLNFRCCARLCA